MQSSASRCKPSATSSDFACRRACFALREISTLRASAGKKVAYGARRRGGGRSAVALTATHNLRLQGRSASSRPSRPPSRLSPDQGFMSRLQVSGVVKRYAQTEVLRGVDLD